MRLSVAVTLLALTAVAGAQTWEKRIAPGLTYREEVDRSIPRIIHVLRWNLGTPAVTAAAQLASGTVFDQTADKGRETVSHMVSRTGAIAGINGDFFHVPYTGDPLGLMIDKGQMVSVPIAPRAVLAWSGDSIKMGIAAWKGQVQLNGGATMDVDGMNEQASNDRLILDTDLSGFALGQAPDVAWIVKLDEGSWTPVGSRTGTITEIVHDLAARKVTSDLAVIIGAGAKAHLMDGAKMGDRVTITNEASGFDWGSVKFAVGGGPTLVSSGKAIVDWKEERFKDTFALNRHPRSAVGITANGDVCLVAVDGRQPGISDGVTLDELAQIMVRLGCVQAMNLDGGGSTCLDVHGLSLNRPSDGKERPIANAILLFADKPPVDPDAPRPPALSLSFPSKIYAESDVAFQAKLGAAAVDNADVIWSASGSAWIDQGGKLHTLDTGKCIVTAWSGDQVASATIDVVERPVAKAARGKIKRKKRKPAPTTEHEDGQ